MDDLFQQACGRPGYRLHRFEAYNWGVFDSSVDGRVYSVRPEGEVALLVGLNGSGKSTLVDGLLTLLVRPGTRNYNVAAGAAKRGERNEKSYIRGAYKHASSDEDNRARPKFLRPGSGHYSCLLAHFHNEDLGRGFTLAQVLYLDASEEAHKIYCYASGERSIAEHLSGLSGHDRIRKAIESRGWQATTNFSQYSKWFANLVGMREKAMDVLNQTVAVKDIRSLNDFIRSHMLEKGNWRERIARVLKHFDDLSQAHRALVEVRLQLELLVPVAKTGAEYTACAADLERHERLLEAGDSYFRQQTIDVLGPFAHQLTREIEIATGAIGTADRRIAEAETSIRKLQNEIENAGGDRLKEIPHLIDKHEQAARTKRSAADHFVAALEQAGLPARVTDAVTFDETAAALHELRDTLQCELPGVESRRTDLAVRHRDLEREAAELRVEIAALEQRRTNLPERFADLRRQLCVDLQLPEKEVPFAAELIAVKPEEHEWEASVEMVLHNFALSLLVPDRYYRQVSDYVNRTRLRDSRGRGQRLVYLRVERPAIDRQPPAPARDALADKIELRAGHALVPWLKHQIDTRFNYQCCDDIAAFQSARDLALTRNRHIKSGGMRHEKDDRDHKIDRRNFVLGWDNKAKLRHLRGELQRVSDEITEVERETRTLVDSLDRLRQRLDGIGRALDLASFETIDFASEEREVTALRREKEDIERASDTIKALKQRLTEVEQQKIVAGSDRDAALKKQTELHIHLVDAENLVANARRILEQREALGVLEQHVEAFADIAALLSEIDLTHENLIEHEAAFKAAEERAIRGAREKLEPLRERLIERMSKFLRKFPAFEKDMRAAVDYVGSFIALKESIESEDLPRHEQRFKERLNEKVTEEIGFLNGELRTESNAIKNKIDVLNTALKQVDYRPGTVMQLEPKAVHDREVTDFKRQLAECLAYGFDGTLEADEARFKHIESLIVRLRDEERWRDKVTDVRRWFDFVAREIDRDTGAERSFYSDSAGQSGGEKAKLAFTILVAAIAYQYDIDPLARTSDRFHFVVIDEMFSKIDDHFAEYALDLFQSFGLQLLIVAPLDAKARVTERHVRYYLHVVKDEETSTAEVFTMTAKELESLVPA